MKQLQQVLFRVPCGLFVVSAIRDGHPNGMINNTVFQIPIPHCSCCWVWTSGT